MKKLLISLVAMMAMGCKNSNDKVGISQASYDRFGDEISIIKVRDCEYIRAVTLECKIYIHCGDCHNPIHQTPKPH